MVSNGYQKRKQSRPYKLPGTAGWHRLTETQIDLVKAIEAGQVVREPDKHGQVFAWYKEEGAEPSKVEVRLRGLYRRDFIELVDGQWQLTEAGHVLLAHVAEVSRPR